MLTALSEYGNLKQIAIKTPFPIAMFLAYVTWLQSYYFWCGHLIVYVSLLTVNTGGTIAEGSC